MNSSPGDRLVTLCASAERSVLFIAPFVKVAAIQRILEGVRSGVEVTCVTRWLPEDVAAGVSDLEVMDVISARPSASLHLHARLHGKLFKVDDACLVGSANITDRALGWSRFSNIELMVDVAASDSHIIRFIKTLMSEAIIATEEIRDAVFSASAKLTGSASSKAVKEPKIEFSMVEWLPACPTPEKLWNVYSDQDVWQLLGGAVGLARNDLLALNIPDGLPRSLFNQYIGSVISDLPVVEEIDRRINSGLSAQEGADLIADYLPSAAIYAPMEAWEVLKRWLNYFRPATYRSVPTSEVFMRGRTLG